MTTKTILVTGPELAPSASQYLANHGYTTVHTPPYADSDVIAKLLRETQAVGVISRMGRLDAATMDAGLPHLKVIAKHGVGVDNIDTAAAAERNIPVVVATGANAVSVAEHTISLLLSTVKRVVPLDKSLHEGRWEKPGFSGVELAGKSMGLFGMGAIAQATAKMAAGFAVKLYGFDPYAPDAVFEEYGVTRCNTIDELMLNSKILSLHCPLTDQTRAIINAENIAKMPVGSYIVNTARGGLIDEEALVAAIQSGHLAGAGLDTFAIEPPSADHPFLKEDAIVVTPHIGGVTTEGSTRVSEDAALGVVRIVEGQALPAHRIINRNLLADMAPFVSQGE
ncbi:hydroxyacid dehydrogenase [Marinomonas ostreistagni]|uniref:hydroxyacid dehydrogenase n=1 Tax=Marinomonas ostreistagni TaxID=359209 RepID=UPI00195045B9|nr:hydroxyacid dehydrogenase [Marinomonas ostreistagni]MBM6550079.1 hydroxyacid dehydrogenase [Marinomonas ostreistagni]